MSNSLRVLVLTGACVFGIAHQAAGAARVRNDPSFLAALQADPALHACGCILAAAWLDESYPRVTVEARRWRKLGDAARVRLSARALKIAEATYLTESAATDQYEQIFIVDRRNKPLFSYEPTVR
jgi:hypothetical protein